MFSKQFSQWPTTRIRGVLLVKKNNLWYACFCHEKSSNLSTVHFKLFVWRRFTKFHFMVTAEELFLVMHETCVSCWTLVSIVFYPSPKVHLRIYAYFLCDHVLNWGNIIKQTHLRKHCQVYLCILHSKTQKFLFRLSQCAILNEFSEN